MITGRYKNYNNYIISLQEAIPVKVEKNANGKLYTMVLYYSTGPLYSMSLK